MSNSLKSYAASQKAGRSASPQRERTPGRTDEVQNNAGGFVFEVSDLTRLERFLILGTDGATYYVKADTQVKDSAKFLTKMIEQNERLVVDTIVDVSINGRAYKNTPAIFALAMVLSVGNDKAYARQAVSKVVRTGTHLFEFASFIDGLGGWGRAKRGAIADWYTGMGAERLAYQAVKYRQREGWTHRDLFRKAHPEGVNPAVGNFILGRDEVRDNTPAANLEILTGFQQAQQSGSVEETVRTLETFKNLPWEALRTEHLSDIRVWKTLFYNGQLQGQALVRNITRLAKMGAFSDMQFAAAYAARLTDQSMLERTRLHPVNFLNAINVYENGQTVRGNYYYDQRKRDWTPEAVIRDALNEAFHLSFKTVEPAGKRTMLAIDVSGSMSSSAMGLDLSCAQVSGAVAMTVARTEPAHIIRGFTSSVGWGRGSDLTDLGISAKTDLNTAMRKVQKSNWGGTDCSLPMTWAANEGIEVDTFAILTDNDTWGGNVKPIQALKQYRDKTGINARLAVFGISGSPFTIADANDKGTMDFVGFDSNAPRAFADFSAGRI